MNTREWQHSLQPLLAPLGHLYALLMQARASAYTYNLFPSWTPSVPCISVGNISWGGTGKTPLISWLLDWADQSSSHPVVLTRGYHATPSNLPFHVQGNASPSEAGDEPLMLAREHPRADIIVDPQRIRSGPWAEERLHPDIFFLDDGFQHLAAKRHIDLVLFSPADLQEDWNKVIPSGSWREGAGALTRAQVFVVNTTGASLDILLPLAKKRLGHFGNPLYFVELVPTCLRNLMTGETLATLDESYFLFTGIANPERVVSTTTVFLKTPPADHLFFPDHHAFGPEDRAVIRERAQDAGARYILCTAKDASKIRAESQDSIWQIETRLRFTGRLNTSLWLPECLEQMIRTV